MKRDPILVVVLSIITCGIYGLYWMYVTTIELKTELKRDDINPVFDLLITILCCGIYSLYWIYRNSQLITEAQRNCGIDYPENNAGLNLVLAVFGVGIISMAIMQNSLNKVWDQGNLG